MFYFAKLSYFCFEFVKAYFKHYLEKSIDHPYFAVHNCTAAFSIIVTDSKARVQLDIINSSNLQPLISVYLRSKYHMQLTRQYHAHMVLRYLFPACFILCCLNFLIPRLDLLHRHLHIDYDFSQNNFCLVKLNFIHFEDFYLNPDLNFFHLSYCYFFGYHQYFSHFH